MSAMSLSWAEIRDKAIWFQDRWKNAAGYERGEAQIFLYELLRDVYGIDPRRVGTFEQKVHPTTDTNGYIDMLWPGRILIEMKSKGKSLDKAHDQARKYAFSITNDEQLPIIIMVCNFDSIRLYNLLTDQVIEFMVKDLPDNVHALSILTEQASQMDFVFDKELNTQAAYKMADLHDRLKANGYIGHDLEVYLVRILFCLFADHTGVFAKRQFSKYIANTREDGSDLAGKITLLFEVLNTAPQDRMHSLPRELSDFPYVDGKLFEETLRSASFDNGMRTLLIECCEFDWSTISPAIFGAMFQSVMDPAKRIALGEQYTPQYIIQKLIKPLIIDELYNEFASCRGSTVRLEQFHNKLARIKILDPACGCGNFLIVTYTMLRKLEIEVLRCLFPKNEELPDDFDLDSQIRVNVGQFFGFDIEEFPCQIAQASMWLVDHKLNVEAAKEFGHPFIRIPLNEKACINTIDALKEDWNAYVDKSQIHYIIGNPPFIGAKKPDCPRKQIQKLFDGYQNSGLLDAVAGWYIQAARFMQGTKIKAAFVSTNSIIQGEQVSALWEPLIKHLNIEIIFGYRPFKWTNEARDMAVVHCVIIGFQAFHSDELKTIYNDDIPEKVSLINPYLDGLPEITFIHRRNSPLCNVPSIGIGNKPIDDGNYLFKKSEKDAFVLEEPRSEEWFREWYGSEEFLSKKPRYCLWLGDCSPDDLAQMPKARERVRAVREFRQHSPSQPTRNIADRPRRFHVENMPSVPYLVIPEVSSEHRPYIPMGFMTPEVLCSNLVKLMPEATLYHFGILTSEIHMIWMRAVCGRLEERYRYSIEIVYNNFPWPDASAQQIVEVKLLAQKILDIRERYHETSYKILYDVDTMPDDLSQAHKALDGYVKKMYGLPANASERDCIIELFRKYKTITEQ